MSDNHKQVDPETVQTSYRGYANRLIDRKEYNTLFSLKKLSNFKFGHFILSVFKKTKKHSTIEKIT